MASSLLRFFATLVLCAAAAPAPALAWSESGHRLVALAAQEILSENAKRRIGYLLGSGAQLSAVANWADEILPTRPETDAWHSITIPPDASAVDLARDCPVGDCITVKVRDCIGIVRLAVKPRAEIVDAFKMLVSLAADMHQPLRNGYPPAHGKEMRTVVLDGREMPLFDAWDSGLLALMGPEEEILARVRQRIASADRTAWTKGTLRAWTWETHRLAVDRVYPMVGEAEKTVLAGPAVEASSDIIVDQLAKAAVRLVAMFEDMWP